MMLYVCVRALIKHTRLALLSLPVLIGGVCFSLSLEKKGGKQCHSRRQSERRFESWSV